MNFSKHRGKAKGAIFKIALEKNKWLERVHSFLRLHSRVLEEVKSQAKVYVLYVQLCRVE
jgi:hypothetical protein